MLMVARALAVLSILLTLAAIEIWGVRYLPIGFEATGVLGGYSFLLATVAAISALVIAIVRARSGKRDRLFLHRIAFRHFLAWPSRSPCDLVHSASGWQLTRNNRQTPVCWHQGPLRRLAGIEGAADARMRGGP